MGFEKNRDRKKRSKSESDHGKARTPEGFTKIDNAILDSPAYAALCKLNPRAIVLLIQLHRVLWHGSPESYSPDKEDKLARNGSLGLPWSKIRPLMSKTARATAFNDLLDAGAIRITTPFSPPDTTARLWLELNPDKWKVLPPRRHDLDRPRGPNGLFLPIEPPEPDQREEPQ